MERHAVPRVVLGAALFALAACSPATGGSASVTPTIEPLQTTTPEATQASLLPDGSWQVDLTPEELIAAVSPVEDAHGGKYTYTFAGTLPGSAAGKTIPLRSELRVLDANHFTYDFYESHDGNEALAVRLEYTRQG